MATVAESPGDRFLDLGRIGGAPSWRAIALIVLALLVAVAPYALLREVVRSFGLPAVIASMSLPGIEFGFLLLLTRPVLRRSWRTVFGIGKISCRRIAAAASLYFALNCLTAVGASMLMGFPARDLSGVDFAMAFGVALLLVPFQAAAEEFSYRGVVLQTLGRATRARALLYVIPGILFAAMHSSQGVGAWIYAEVFAASCFLTWLVMREGNLAAAIGAHAGNNISAVVFGNADSPIYPHALFLDSGPTTMIDVLCSIGTMVAFVVIWSLVDRPAADRHGFVAVST